MKLQYIEVYEGKLTEVGCGCCEYTETPTRETVDKAITETTLFLRRLKDLRKVVK